MVNLKVVSHKTQLFIYTDLFVTKLNEKFYKIHLENAKEWDNLWHCIQAFIEYKLQVVSETLYTRVYIKQLYGKYITSHTSVLRICVMIGL